MKAAPEKGGKATKPATKDGDATPTQRTPEAAAPPEHAPGLTPRHLQRLQGMAGNAAVSRLVAQRYTAPVKPPPSQAPGFRRVQSDVAAKKQKLSQHNPAADESKSAQDAAVAPPDDKEAQGKAANAEKMNDAKPGEFNKAAFIEAVNQAIADQAPKNLDEADKFSDSGKAEKIKGEVDGKVTDGKNASSKDIETTTTAAPDTSQAKEKEVTPMKPDQPPANPGAPNAADATPQQQPPEVTDFSEGPKKTDQQMADADVTEEQLAKSNEPEFTDALSEKKKAEQHSATAPNQARATEKEHLATAKSNAAAAGTQAMASLTATRNAAGKQVDGGKGETKSKDEQKRQEVTAKLQKVFDATQKDVETILSGLDGKVDKQFEDGEKKARDAFNTDQKRRMKAYKKKRYGGFFGPAKWAKDKLMGMPEEANQLFQESRKLYVTMMQGVISSIADTIGTELGKAKARIAQGRADIKTEVDKLPADLKQYGQEAAKDFAGKFDDLESEVNDKSQQLVQTLAQKYTQALNAVDEEIKKLQEANKGLVQKAVDAVVGVIKTINELKNLLMGILAKAAGAITKIIKDPIGFLGNLVRAVGAGLQQFISNIGTHLQTGLVSWLLGTSAKAGIEIPSKFDLKGIIQIIASLLGLTWANIRARITRKGVPEQAMSAAEQSVPVAKALATEGPAGAAKEITAETGDLKSTILDDLKSYLVPTVIIAGITWILSLLNPASAFVRAVKGIIDIVTFVVNQGAQIVEFVNAVLDAVVAIANGGSAGVPKMVETALATSIPLLIGLLASLLGIGGLANKIKQVFQKVSRPVNRAIDKIAAKIAQAAKKLWSKTKAKVRGGDDSPQGKRQRLGKAISVAERALARFSGKTVGKIALTPVLTGIRARYGLTSLTVAPDGTRWNLHGAINPSAIKQLQALVLTPKQIADFDTIEAFLVADGQARQVVLLRSVLRRQAKGGNISGFEHWVDETGSRAAATLALLKAGTATRKDRDQVYDKIAEVVEIRRLSDEIASDPNKRVRFNPGNSSGKSYDIHVEQQNGSGGYRTIRRVEVATSHENVVANPTQLNAGIAHGIEKLGASPPPRTTNEPTAESTVIIPWNHSSPVVVRDKKGQQQVLLPDGKIEIRIKATGKVVNTRSLFDDGSGNASNTVLANLNAGTVGSGSHQLDAINIVSQDGKLIWRGINAGSRSGANNWSTH
ncbi:phage tail protein [Streptomyces sparsogenes]|uniref:phage tail protein n=1 Tax=Streptomyces sparsogenes TaxID=67365 RepID=UPI003F4D2377